jgi:hypothetical protein
MRIPRGSIVAAALIIVGGCSSPSGPPAGSAAAGSPAAASVAASASTADVSRDAVLTAFLATIPATTSHPPGRADVRADQMLASMDAGTTIGSNSVEILAVAAAAEDAVRVLAGPAADARSGVVYAVAIAALPTPSAPPPDNELREALEAALGSVGRPGYGSLHIADPPSTATQADGGLSGTAVLSQSIDLTIEGSVVHGEVEREIDTTVVDTKTGATVFDSTKKYLIKADFDVCPTAAGIVNASIDHTYDVDATAPAGPNGRVGTHFTGNVVSSSAFRGQVDDSAVLGAVTQDYDQSSKWKRTAAAAGGPELAHEGSFDTAITGIGDGVPAAHDWSVTVGDWSDISGTMSFGGDSTPETFNSTIFSAGLDFTTVDSSYVEAQQLFRSGRCLMVTSPTYDAKTPLEPEDQDSIQHSEHVQKGSSTPFQVGLQHRFGGSVKAAITATLSGAEKLDPLRVETPPGTLTYVAPNEDGKEAQVKLVAVSRQGIGTLVLAFDTKTGGWKLSGNAAGSSVHGQKCGGLGGVWPIVGQISSSGLTMDVTFSVTIDGATGAGTFTVKEVGTVAGGFVTTITGSGKASVVEQPDGTVRMTLDAINATSSVSVAGTTVSTTVPIPGGTYTWVSDDSCKAP